MSSSFYPTSTNRVSNQQTITRLLSQVNTDENSIQKLQTQLSTGRRIERPSEDPSAAIRALAAQRAYDFKTQIATNLKAADTILGASESALSQAQSILNEMRGLAVGSSGNLLSDQERTANADLIQNAIEQLVALGNSKFRDQYLFSGSNVNAPPLQVIGNAVRFSGTDKQLETITDYGATISSNVTADETFGTRSDQIVSTIDLNPSLLPSTPLKDLNYGVGVRGGSITLGSASSSIQVDLSRAYTLQDVVDAVQSKQIDGRDLRVTINTSGISIDYADGLGGLLRVDEVGSGLTASDLGIRAPGSPSPVPIIGNDLNLIANNQTRLSQLFGGLGISSGSTFQLIQNNQSYVIGTTGLTTIEDLINRIEASGARVQASLDSSGRYFSLQSTESGTTLSIGESGGNLATRLGIRTFDLTTPVSRLNSGQGIYSSDISQDLVIKRTDGTTMNINLDGVQTVSDVLSRINNHVANFVPSLRVVASLSTNGNGIVLTAPSGANPIEVTSAGGSQSAWGLGLVPLGQSTKTGSTVGANNVINGLDVSGIEVEGTFTTLTRLQDAIRQGDTSSMEHLVQSLDADIQRLSMSRSVVGTRQQNIVELQTRTEDQQTQLKAVESDEIDADLAAVISNLTARQAALQASLQIMGMSSQMSLFNYL